MKWYILFIFFSLMLQLDAQSSAAGYWEGKLTQDKGGYRSEYRFEVYIIQNGETLTGRSLVFVDDIYAEMAIEGRVHSKLFLILKDTRIIEDKISEGMEWCLKNYQLVLKREDQKLILEGHWQGQTSFSSCIPGKIILEKIEPRA